MCFQILRQYFSQPLVCEYFYNWNAFSKSRLGVQTGPSNLCPVGGRSIFLLQLCVQVMTSLEDVLLCNRKSGALRARNDAHNSIIQYSTLILLTHEFLSELYSHFSLHSLPDAQLQFIRRNS